MPSSENRIARLTDLLPDDYRHTWVELSSVLGYPLQLFNLRNDLEKLLSLQGHINNNPTSPEFFKHWFSLVDYLKLNEKSLSSKLDLPGGRFPTTRRGGRYGNQYEGHFPDHPLLACLNQTFDESTHTAGTFFRIELIIFARQQYSKPDQTTYLATYADDVRKAARPTTDGHTIFKRLGNIKAPIEQWNNFAMQELQKISKEDTSTSKKISRLSNRFLRLIKSTATDQSSRQQVPKVIKSDGWCRSYIDNSGDANDSADTYQRPLQIRIPISPPLIETEDIDLVGLDPDFVHFDIADDVPSDGLVPLRAVEQQQQRYTNYRTALANQRLPYAWNQLNEYEVSVLVTELRQDLASDDHEVKVQALLTSLTLIIGNHIHHILEMPLYDHQSKDCLLEGSFRVRYVRPAHMSYVPTDEQMDYLRAHTSYVQQPLPQEIKKPLHTMLSRSVKSVGESFGIDAQTGERLVREYLQKLRDTHHVRLTVGRVRNVLANGMMKITGDKTLVHLLTSKQTDMPPAGAYYISFDVNRAVNAYKNTVDKFFNRD